MIAQGTAPAPDDALLLDTSDGTPHTAAAQILAWIDAHH